MLGCQQGKISKIEGQTCKIDTEELDTLAQFYKLSASKTAELRELHQNSTVPQKTPGYPLHTPEFARLVSVETDAQEILSWHSERIPGPLQHLRYMSKQLELDQPDNRQFVAAAYAARKSRLNIFTVERPPRYRVILSESSIHRMPGGSRELAIDQIKNLLDLVTRYEQFELRIIPFSANLPYADSDFAVLRFPPELAESGSHDDFVYLEHRGGGEILKDLSKFVEYWDHTLTKAALGCDETVVFLSRRMDELSKSRSVSWQ